ncbi:MAG: polysaccharide biosynthesis protein [Gammaproteobacteria bacterium]|nr:polysaccharide biosynthesis protein [Gammaproteobacteria bacterium]
MNILPTLRTRTVIFIHDLAMVALAWLGAYWLRFNLAEIPEPFWEAAIKWLPVVMVLQGLSLRIYGLYRGVWRFASVPDLLRIVKAVATGAFVIAGVTFITNRLAGVPRSVLPLYIVLLTLMLSSPRLLYRIWKDRSTSLRDGERALIVGAGNAGEALVRDLLRDRDSKYLPVAFVDDDPNKRGREIHSLRVRAGCDHIPNLVQRLDIDVILIAVPSATDREMRRIVEICEGTKLPFMTLPSVQNIFTEQLGTALRDVSIEDLLGRAPVRLDRSNVDAHLRGKRVFVTGGGGSIGSELCKQIARFPVAELTIFERCEFNLYRIAQELARSFPALRLRALLGDVSDRHAIDRALAQARPDILFHAAAYKHVPLLEYQLRQAVLNNVLGTRTVAEIVMQHGVSEFVLISTDKAVKPTNVMGATKRAAEMMVQDLNRRGATRFVTVRFGNVLDSAGSVVPLFREQIQTGGPVTVTHPDVTRYFMTIPEACQLIMQASAVGKGGEVFVLDMGDPIKISYLAEQMIRLSGKRLGEDVHIVYTGLRPGEKLHEELFLEQERLLSTGHNKLRLARPHIPDAPQLRARIEELVACCRDGEDTEILASLRKLVPEFVPGDSTVDANGSSDPVVGLERAKAAANTNKT